MSACLVLANCSSQTTGFSRVDPKYGVSSSPRVVGAGEPVPKGGGTYRIGKPYVVAGRTYVPEEDVNYRAEGMASWYGDAFHGRLTANGEVFDMASLTAAHPTLPIPSYARVTNVKNGKSLIVRVNDRGPYHGNRLIDVSNKAAELLEFKGNGIARVRVEYVGRAPLEGSDDRKLMATLRENSPAVAPIQVAANKQFAPAYFDGRSMAKYSSAQVPTPPDRPYRLGEGAREVPGVEPDTTEFAAAARPRNAGNAMRAPVANAAPAVSPVSAYAPARYDGRADFQGGRGLY